MKVFKTPAFSESRPIELGTQTMRANRVEVDHWLRVQLTRRTFKWGNLHEYHMTSRLARLTQSSRALPPGAPPCFFSTGSTLTQYLTVLYHLKWYDSLPLCKCNSKVQQRTSGLTCGPGLFLPLKRLNSPTIDKLTDVC
jgi:hypothetical protein